MSNVDARRSAAIDPATGGGDGEWLEAITDQARLERIHDRLVEAKGWDDLLATP